MATKARKLKSGILGEYPVGCLKDVGYELSHLSGLGMAFECFLREHQRVVNMYFKYTARAWDKHTLTYLVTKLIKNFLCRADRAREVVSLRAIFNGDACSVSHVLAI
tara:strand:+ start:330 stop:650 length:321 start_codon:yes stop_codon:yes gene_type:complete